MSSRSFRKYTLVLDLDETLIHCATVQDQSHTSQDTTIRFQKRPGLPQFLKEMSHYFEIVVFTAAGKEYADAVIDSLTDCKDSISHRLYWDHVTVVNAGGKDD